MNLLRLAEFKVGLLVVAVGGIIAFMSMQVSDDPSFLSKNHKVWFLMPNAGGLVKNSAVKSAGIPVGAIKDISLQDGQARIDISVKSNIPLTTSAYVEIKAQGILGDSHVEVYPGSPTDPPLSEGAQILTVKNQGSLDNLIGSVTEVTDSLKEVAKDLKEAVSEDGTKKHILGRIVKNIEQLTGDIAEMTSKNKNKINEIVDQVHDVTSELRDVLKDNGDSGFRATWQKASDAIKNLDEVSQKINSGEGTIGKLINDEQTAENLDTAIDGISSLVDTANRIQTGFDYHADYLSAVGAAKSTVGIVIQPGLDRYYYLGVVDDPMGEVQVTSTKTTNNNGGGVVSDITEEKNYKNNYKITAYFAKNFWDLTLRGGLIENTGGFGIDYHFFDKKLRVTLEALDFTHVNVRPSIAYTFYRGLYIQGGMNDMFNKGDRRSSYLGAGLYLTNDDIKLLLTRAPF